jgi:hypothetical protein
LIALTVSQHYQKAHEKGNTYITNKDYQYVCLLAKSDTIEKSITRGEMTYTIPNFVYVLNTGLSLDLSSSETIQGLKNEIDLAYNS